MTVEAQDIIFQCDASQVSIMPGVGWVVSLTDKQILMPHVFDAIQQFEAGGSAPSIKLAIANNPIPPGFKVAIRGPDGRVFPPIAEPVTVHHDEVRDAMLAAKPQADSAVASVLAHRSGKSVMVSGRTLRGMHQGGGSTDTKEALVDRLATSPDTFFAAFDPSGRAAIEAGMRVARGYVFDRAASFRIGELVITAAKLIADSQEFARLPYPVVWVELDQKALLDGMASRGAPIMPATYEPDERMGFLYTGHGVYTGADAVMDDGTRKAGWSPIAYRMGRPMTDHQRHRWNRLVGGGDEVIDRFLWGNVYNPLDRSRRAALRHYSGIDILIPDHVAGNEQAPLAPILQGGGAGDWKVALACLLTIIRPGVAEQRQIRMPQRKLTARGSRKLIGLTTVTINISARATKSLVKAGLDNDRAARAATRWHEVRGHYMHNRVAREADCIHDWHEVEPNRWECRHCGGKRAWREYPNGRGFMENGIVAKHYRVTSKGGQNGR